MPTLRRIVPWVLVGAALGAGIAIAALAGGSSRSVQRVIVDYSPTLSDVPALLSVAARSDVDLLAVTLPGTGESSCEEGVRHTRELLSFVGRGEVPVGCGREEPLAGNRDWPEEWRQSADALPGLDLPPVPDAPAPDAVDLLVDTLAGARDVTVITLGPLTNLGLLARDHRESLGRIGRIVTMGGAVDVLGNVEDEPSTEWNLFIDPEADRLVLESGVPWTLVPLDATNHVPGNRRFLARAQFAQEAPEGEAAVQLWNGNAPGVASEGFYFWDELAAMAAFEPELVTFETKALATDDLGATVERPDGTPVQVATRADQAAFEASLLETLNGAPLPEPKPLTATEREYAQALADAFTSLDDATDDVRPPADASPIESTRLFLRALFDGVAEFDQTLGALRPPGAYVASHETMQEGAAGIVALSEDAFAALDSPEAAASANPFEVVSAAVAPRFDPLQRQLLTACTAIAGDLLVRDGPELSCLTTGG